MKQNTGPKPTPYLCNPKPISYHLYLSIGVQGRFAIFRNCRIFHDAIVPGGHHDHLLWTKDDLLVVLANEGFWACLHLSDIAGLIQDMEIVVRWDTVDALSFRVFLAPIHYFPSQCVLQKKSVVGARIKGRDGISADQVLLSKLTR